jgi:lipopolysaccharide biosynthesis glycosyltransferase
MDRLEVHTLICKKDIQWWLDTLKLFKHHSQLDYKVIIHEDGSFENDDFLYLKDQLEDVKIISRQEGDELVKPLLSNYELCSHFRFAEHHTIFRIKLFDPFLLTESNNVLQMDADILFCKTPTDLINNINNKTGCYIKDTWSSYCVPFRDEDNDTLVDRFINAGMIYSPTKQHYNLDYIEQCLEILYNHGSRGATHPFLEQNCIAYMMTQQNRNGIIFNQLSHPEYCIPTFNQFIPDHNLTVLHLNSSPLVGRFKKEHYDYELNKLFS